MAQQALDQLQKERNEAFSAWAFSAWSANPSSDLEKECDEDLKISLHRAEDAVNSLAAAAASTSVRYLWLALSFDKQLCILLYEVTQSYLVSMRLLKIIQSPAAIAQASL